MNVAVLGAGGGGLAVAYEWASQGHRVSLYAQRAHDHHLAPVRERGGIQAEGLLEGFAPLERVTSDIAKALEGVEVVFVVGPAYATEPFDAECTQASVPATRNPVSSKCAAPAAASTVRIASRQPPRAPATRVTIPVTAPGDTGTPNSSAIA